MPKGPTGVKGRKPPPVLFNSVHIGKALVISPTGLERYFKAKNSLMV
jgi:hypothetical protein